MRILTALLASVFLVTGCGNVHTPGQDIGPSSTPAVTPGAQAKLVLLAASRTDQQLDVSAQLLDGRGNGIPGIDVQFGITGGTVTPQIVKTDGNGMAKAIAVASGTATLSATTGALSQTSTVIGGATALSVNLFIGTVTIGSASPLSASVSGTPIGGPFAYVWTYGDGVIESGSSATMTHAYATRGTYSASVKVTDGAGRSATGMSLAVVSDPPAVVPPATTPDPALSLSLTCTPGTHGSATVCNLSGTFGAATLAGTSFLHTDYDFGDGRTDNINNSPLVSHTYAQAGTYTITATATQVGTTQGVKAGSATARVVVP